ncbi:MAG: membrane protein insertase YidC [Erysipelotrichaceae bacterium]|nr:membrane protein insertase YidC [Erysipelotrichaceae bacterium]
MVLDARTKKYAKMAMLLVFVALLSGCARNLDANGQLIAERAITATSPWTPAAGIFDFLLVIPIAKGIIFLSGVTGNVIWGIIALTVLINIIILPIMIRSTVSTQKMQLIQPEMQRIQDKYRGRNDQASQLRMQQEIQNLYEKNNVSMLGSFATFLTLPIMIAMWQAVQRVEILYSSTAFGLKLGIAPMSQVLSGKIPYIILIILMGGTQFLAIQINTIMMKRSKSYRQNQANNSMHTMNITMTVMIIYFGLIMPAAMSFYWITTNIITIIRTIFIQIFVIEKEEKARESRVIR